MKAFCFRVFIVLVLFGVFKANGQDKDQFIPILIKFGNPEQGCTGKGICEVGPSGKTKPNAWLASNQSGEWVLRMNKAELIDALRECKQIGPNRLEVRDRIVFSKSIQENILELAPYIGETEKNIGIRKGIYTIQPEGEFINLIIE
jgi:hypothetical protein